MSTFFAHTENYAASPGEALPEQQHRGLLHRNIVKLRITPVGAASILLSLWGCLAIYSATSHLSPSFLFVGRQLAWLPLAILALILCSSLPAQAFRRLAPWLAVPAFAALCLVLQFGVRVNGMRGWFAWEGIFFQPAVLAKPVFILLTALLLYKTQSVRGDWLRGYLPVLGVGLFWIVPIALQPDFGAVLLYAATLVVMCLCLGVRRLHVVLSALPLPAVAYAIVTWKPYVAERLSAFLHPDSHPYTSGWHIAQFQKALAAGGWTGKTSEAAGGSQTVVPVAYSDSIFACLGENIGFIGILPIVLLVGAWVFYGYTRLQRTDDDFRAAVILGCTVMLAGQSCLHLSVNLGLFPITGLTLPLISYGGSSLVATMITIGIVESMARPADAYRPAGHSTIDAGETYREEWEEAIE